MERTGAGDLRDNLALWSHTHIHSISVYILFIYWCIIAFFFTHLINLVQLLYNFFFQLFLNTTKLHVQCTDTKMYSRKINNSTLLQKASLSINNKLQSQYLKTHVQRFNAYNGNIPLIPDKTVSHSIFHILKN